MAIYSGGMITWNITEQIKNLYDVEISAKVIPNITSRFIALVLLGTNKNWQLTN